MVRRDRHGLSERDHLALDAAKLYHVDGLSQAGVAEHLHVSRPQVSKLLATAREKRFVRTVVVDPRESDGALVETLREVYDLTDLRLVVPVGRGPTDRHRALGSAAAQMLGDQATSDRDLVGFWWRGGGQAVLEAMARMRVRPRALVQLDGTAADGRVTASLAAFAERSPVPVHPCPLPILHASITDRLAAEHGDEARRVLTLQAECDVAVFGAAGTAPGRLGDEVHPEEREEIAAQAVGRICGRFLDEDGRLVAPSLSQRTLGPTLSDLRRIRRSVLVASGAELVPVIRAALRHRYANHLVTDVDTAVALAAAP